MRVAGLELSLTASYMRRVHEVLLRLVVGVYRLLLVLINALLVKVHELLVLLSHFYKAF